jgi:hypothetical protein
MFTSKDRPERATTLKSFKCFELIDHIHYLLEGWSGNRDVFGSLSHISSTTVHYNAGVRDDVEEYGCVWVDLSAVNMLKKVVVDKYKGLIKVIIFP